LKKDELLSVCRRQETLLEEARRLLSEKQRLLEQLLAGAAANETAMRELSEANRQLSRENGELRAQCAAQRDCLDALERQSAIRIEQLNEAWRTSCATWAAEWNERWTALSTRLRTLEADNEQQSSKWKGNWPGLNSDEMPNSIESPADPEDCERIVTEFVAGLMSDLEKTLTG